MLAKDVRRRWAQYGENRKILQTDCWECGKVTTLQIDHIKPMGPRPRTPEDFCDYIYRMFNNKCQALCKPCHTEKTKLERERRYFDKTTVLRRKK